MNLDKLMGKMSQKKLEELSGVPRGRIGNWMKRRTLPDAGDIEALAKAFNVEAYYFFMKPGTQGEARPTERRNGLEVLIDDIAKSCLNEIELESYKEAGQDEYARILRTNYETPHILPVKWALKINAKLAKYVTVDLQEKLDSSISEPASKKA